MARRPEHHFGTRRSPLGRMGCTVVWAKVCFNFDDVSDKKPAINLMDKLFAEQLDCDVDRVSRIKFSCEFFKIGGGGRHLLHLPNDARDVSRRVPREAAQ